MRKFQNVLMVAFGLILLTPLAQAQTLGTTNLLEGPAAGSASVVVSATGAWTAGTGAIWLHLSAANQSGTGSMNVVFTLDANSGATRTGTLTIAGQTLTVVQAGANYVAAGSTTTLVSSGLNQPVGVAVDGTGNVYIADTSNSAIKQWTAASNTVTTLVSSGLNYPFGVAVDGAGNVYIADYVSQTIKQWTAANHTVTTLVPSGLSYPSGVAVDGAGNVYIADYGNSAIKQWTVANSTVTNLVTSGLSYTSSVAVDGAGNVYIADYGHNAIKQWTAASNTVTTLVASGLFQPAGVAVDDAGNVYIADTYNSAMKELPRAFVDATAKAESALAGSDVLPVILPATQNLTGPFTPTSDSAWLTISGVTNGVVHFAFTANNNASPRTGNLTVLGQTITVTQASSVVVTPPTITGAKIIVGGSFQMSFSSQTGVGFTVLSTTNLSLALTNWTLAGVAVETPVSSGQYQFTDSSTTNSTRRFYRVRTP